MLIKNTLFKILKLISKALPEMINLAAFEFAEAFTIFSQTCSKLVYLLV